MNPETAPPGGALLTTASADKVDGTSLDSAQQAAWVPKDCLLLSPPSPTEPYPGARPWASAGDRALPWRAPMLAGVAESVQTIMTGGTEENHRQWNTEEERTQMGVQRGFLAEVTFRLS